MRFHHSFADRNPSNNDRAVFFPRTYQVGIKTKTSMVESIHETIHVLLITKINVRNLTDATNALIIAICNKIRKLLRALVCLVFYRQVGLLFRKRPFLKDLNKIFGICTSTICYQKGFCLIALSPKSCWNGLSG